MKKLILTFALLLTVSFAFAGNEIEKTSVIEVEEIVSVELIEADLKLENNDIRVDCWEEANAAEEAYCGSVGCSDDYWFGYMEGCMS